VGGRWTKKVLTGDVLYQTAKNPLRLGRRCHELRTSYTLISGRAADNQGASVSRVREKRFKDYLHRRGEKRIATRKEALHTGEKVTGSQKPFVHERMQESIKTDCCGTKSYEEGH